MTIFKPTPKRCDTCGTPFTGDVGEIMYDAKTRYGPWACMCENCFSLGPGLGRLGTGYGQKYERRHDGNFHKVGG